MRRPLWIIVGLLTLYAVLSWTAVSGKSATYDEPIHLAAAVAQTQAGDYRLEPEHPAGFKAWLGLALPQRPLVTDTHLWQNIGKEYQAQWGWSLLTIFGQDDGEALSVIARGRFMMLLVALGLGVVIAAWAWQIGGPTAGIVATALFALDPTFIGHGPIAKNDVIATLGFVGSAFALWHVGRRATVWSVAGLAIAVAATVSVKSTGLMLGLLVPVMLLVPCSKDELTMRGLLKRLGLAAGVTAIVGVACFAVIWAVYGFRYAPSPDPSFQFDVAKMAWDKPVLRMVDRYHLLPQAYTYGLAFTLEITQPRKAFLLGQVSEGGWWYYFPVAMAVKTPLATITMLLVAIGAMFRLRLRRHSWTMMCLLVPAAFYAVMAVRSNLNIGVRHMMPVYPLAFIAIGVVLSRHARLATGLLVLLAVESATVFPNDLAYFNLAAGGSRGGIRILSDSNLDWGQDLPLLAEWQRKHPEKRLYLSYFGTAPPSSYGVEFTNVGAGYGFLPTTMPAPGESGVIAISATHLQGMYVAENLQWFYKALRKKQPIAVLGGTIYLYEWQ